jgi:hypothetical protein
MYDANGVFRSENLNLDKVGFSLQKAPSRQSRKRKGNYAVLGKAFVIQDERHLLSKPQLSNSSAKDTINSQLVFSGILVKLGLR